MSCNVSYNVSCKVSYNVSYNVSHNVSSNVSHNVSYNVSKTTKVLQSGDAQWNQTSKQKHKMGMHNVTKRMNKQKHKVGTHNVTKQTNENTLFWTFVSIIIYRSLRRPSICSLKNSVLVCMGGGRVHKLMRGRQCWRIANILRGLQYVNDIQTYPISDAVTQLVKT